MAEANKVTANLKMKIKAGQASPAPPVGSTLGQYGVNMMDFITLRDQESLDLMQEVGVTNPYMYLAADSALIVRSSDDARVDQIMQDLGLAGESALIGIKKG